MSGGYVLAKALQNVAFKHIFMVMQMVVKK